MNTLVIEDFLKGVVSTEKIKEGIKLQRFHGEQMPAWKLNAMYEIAAGSAAGISLMMETNADSLILEYGALSGIKQIMIYGKLLKQPFTPYQIGGRMGFVKAGKDHPRFKKGPTANALGEKGMSGECFDVLINGKYCYSVEAKKERIEFPLKNPEHKRQRVQIYFPYNKIMWLKSLQIDGTAASVEQEKMLCLGDSITHGGNNIHSCYTYVARISRRLNLEVVNQGITGYVFNHNSLNGLDKLPFTPKFITVAYGTNDWQYAPDLATAKRAMEEYFVHLHDIFPAVPIYVITPIWRADEEIPYGVGGMDRWREMILAEAEKYENVTAIRGELATPHDPSYYQDGMLHPNDAGSESYADYVLKCIQME